MNTILKRCVDLWVKICPSFEISSFFQILKESFGKTGEKLIPFLDAFDAFHWICNLKSSNDHYHIFLMFWSLQNNNILATLSNSVVDLILWSEYFIWVEIRNLQFQSWN